MEVARLINPTDRVPIIQLSMINYSIEFEAPHRLNPENAKKKFGTQGSDSLDLPGRDGRRRQDEVLLYLAHTLVHLQGDVQTCLCRVPADGVSQGGLHVLGCT